MRIVCVVVATLVLFGASPNSARSQFIDEEFKLANNSHQLRQLTDSPRATDSGLVVSNQDSVFHWSHLAWQVAATQATFAALWLAIPKGEETFDDSWSLARQDPNIVRVFAAGLSVAIVECIVGNAIYSENQSIGEHLALSALGSVAMFFPTLLLHRQYPPVYWQYSFSTTAGSIASYYLLRMPL